MPFIVSALKGKSAKYCTCIFIFYISPVTKTLHAFPKAFKSLVNYMINVTTPFNVDLP